VSRRSDRWLRWLFVLAVLGMMVLGMRLNQHDAISTAKREVRAEILKSTYAQDVESRNDRVKACRRGKADRIAQREGWRTARNRALRAAKVAPNRQERAFQLRARETYSRIVISLSARIEPLDCERANPMPVAPRGVGGRR
jgi:hypothetical protein